MQIGIDIDENIYTRLFNNDGIKYEDAVDIAKTIRKGTPLRKLKWISVDERLPERDVDVLAYVRGASFDYQRVMWIDDYSGKWVGYIGSGLYDRVIAWMPLPEPYMCKNEEVIEGV